MGSRKTVALVQGDTTLGGLSNVRLVEPQGYRKFVALMARCRLVLNPYGDGKAAERVVARVRRFLG